MKSVFAQVRPHVFVALPRVYSTLPVVNVVVDRMPVPVVQVLPPSHESCTQIFGAPLVDTVADALASLSVVGQSIPAALKKVYPDQRFIGFGTAPQTKR